MSTGNLRYERKTDAELYKMLGEGDTPVLYARPVEIDTSHDIPYTGGNSVDGRTVYIDRRFYRDVMSGKIAVKGMAPSQVIQAIVEHEHTEKSIDDGDNPVDTYPPAHEFAIAKEQRFVHQLGASPERYEAALSPALKACSRRPSENPPRDLWCGPYLDDPDAQDKVILRQLRAKGVEDASKIAKKDVHYGIGANECADCAMFGKSGGVLRKCELVSGLVRNDRQCDRWSAKGKKDV